MKRASFGSLARPGIRLLGVAGLALGLTLAATAPQLTTAPAADAAVQPCSNGLIALTFDDGPSPTLTDRFVDVLLAKKVPATFFMVGERAAANPTIVRRVYNEGFDIANHTWSHQHLPTMTDREIADSLTQTQNAFRAIGVTPTNLMRPPWGETNSRVEAVVRSLGLTQVLWNVSAKESDPSATTTQLIDRWLEDLRPGGNHIALMHDAWAKLSLAALPTFIDKARALGYCFAELGSSGQVLAPVPTANVFNDWVYEQDFGQVAYLRFVVRLSEPTSRATSVRVRTVAGTAKAYDDFDPRDFRLDFPVGVTQRVVRVLVRGDVRREASEQLTLSLSSPSGLRVGDGIAVGTIRNDD